MTILHRKWSIGLYQGDSPFSLKPIQQNPVIQALDINDLSADFIADPFMQKHNGQWYLFFEILPEAESDNQTPKGVIGCAVSKDGIKWKYLGTVLSEPYHLSYPFIFQYKGEYYMMPETLGADAISLYKAEAFPNQWTKVNELLPGRHADATPFYYQQRWWLFSCSTPDQHDELELHFADNLTGPWSKHPASPLISNDCRTARPAGRVIQWQGNLYRFAQDCYPRYGSQVRAFEIKILSTDDYLEVECEQSPILKPSGQGWNGRNMHHIDLHQLDDGTWFACADGYHLD